MIAWAGDATWIERWITFVDALRQVAKVRADDSWSFFGDAIERWRDIQEESCFRYVTWIGARGFDGHRFRSTGDAVLCQSGGSPPSWSAASATLGSTARIAATLYATDERGPNPSLRNQLNPQAALLH